MAKKLRKAREPRITERDVLRIVKLVRRNFMINRDLVLAKQS